MASKRSNESYLDIALESSFADGGAGGVKGTHVIPEFEITPPAPDKEIIWAQDHTTPALTNVKNKKAESLSVSTENVWNMFSLYAFMGDGSYAAAGTGIISASTGNKTVSFHANINGSKYVVSGCAIDELKLIVPEGGGNLTMEYTAICADISEDASVSAPTKITESFHTWDGTYTFYRTGAAISDVFLGGSITFTNNYNTDTPDLPNQRIYEPAKGNLGCEVTAKFRLDEDDNFLQEYIDGSTGVFNVKWEFENSVSSGLKFDISGLGITSYSEPIPTSEAGIIDQEITFVQMEDFNLQNIQVTGADFT